MACECDEGIPTPELLWPGSSPGRSSLSRTSAPAPGQPWAVSLLLHALCVRPQEAARGRPGSTLITSGLRGGGLQQSLLQLNCSIFGATSTPSILLKVQSLSSATFMFLEDTSLSFLQEEWIWIQVCCWYLLFHLLVFPELGYKIWSFPFPRDCIEMYIFNVCLSCYFFKWLLVALSVSMSDSLFYGHKMCMMGKGYFLNCPKIFHEKLMVEVSGWGLGMLSSW